MSPGVHSGQHCCKHMGASQGLHPESHAPCLLTDSGIISDNTDSKLICTNEQWGGEVGVRKYKAGHRPVATMTAQLGLSPL